MRCYLHYSAYGDFSIDNARQPPAAESLSTLPVVGIVDKRGRTDGQTDSSNAVVVIVETSSNDVRSCSGAYSRLIQLETWPRR